MAKAPKAGSAGEEQFALHCRVHHLQVEREFRFHPVRKFRFDFAIPAQLIAIEIEGGTWNAGRHNRGSGFETDCVKYNLAAKMGWRVLRFTTEMVNAGTAITDLLEMLRIEQTYFPVLSPKEGPVKMKELRNIALVTLLCLAVASVAQTPHRIFPLGSIGPVLAMDTDTSFTATASPIACGRVSSPLYCYGIPLVIDGQPAGTFWLDTYLSGTNAGSGFIVWNGVADLAEATVTGNSTVGGTGMPSQVTVTFQGGTNDGDSGSYTGTLTLNFQYFYSAGGGGRGGAGAGYRRTCTGGSVSITYN